MGFFDFVRNVAGAVVAALPNSPIAALTALVSTVICLFEGDPAPPPTYAPKPDDTNYPRPDWLPEGINWAVCGESGCGKSSFINSVRNLRASDPGAAAVGVCECTSEPQAFDFPGLSHVKIWDLPGANTRKIPAAGYIRRFGLRHFNGVIVITGERLTTIDTVLLSHLNDQHVPWYLVRSKLDEAIDRNENDHGKSADETRTEIKQKLAEEMRETDHKLSASHIYLVTARANRQNESDWALLFQDVTSDLRKTVAK